MGAVLNIYKIAGLGLLVLGVMFVMIKDTNDIYVADLHVSLNKLT